MNVSVIICAHNPNLGYLGRVLDSLQSQSLSTDYWELLLIDNGSRTPLDTVVDLSWHPRHRIVREEKVGLIHARVRGVEEAQYEYLVSVDDDTPLFPDYLEHALRIFSENPELGIIGGRTVPLFEATPPGWLNRFYTCLAIRDLGEKAIVEKILPGAPVENYPACAPILIAPRKECMLKYIEYYRGNAEAQTLGRRGTDLASGEDNDINLFIYRNGYALGYFPELKFYHIIPANRMTKAYLAKLQYSMNRTWVKVLHLHGITPWRSISRYTIPLRKAKSWLAYRAWRSDPDYISWRGACGTFEGLADIRALETAA